MIDVGKILLLCIGVNEYKYLPNNSLKYSVKDAKLIYDGYSRYNCDYDNILIDSNATKEEILKSIEIISSRARDNDYVILSFAGHGLAKTEGTEEIDSKNCFICPYNFDPRHVDITGISLYEINAQIKKIKSRHRLLLLDACHSGGALRRDIQEFNFRDIKTQELLDLVVQGSGNAIITACDSNEAALEDDKFKQGIFTYFFNEVLYNTEKKYLDFKETQEKICEKVKTFTNDKQHPQSKCDGENFVIPKIPKTIPVTEEIKLDLSVLPTQKETKLKNIDEFEGKIISLIQNKRNIELDRTVKETIKEAYRNIAELISPPHNDQKENVIAIYETCRNYIKPIILIFEHILDYGEESIVLDNLDLIFRFEEISYGMSGLTVIVQMPSILISEIIFKLIGKAHKKRYPKVIRKFFTLAPEYYRGRSTPFIYSGETWHPEIFNCDVRKFFEYLYPIEKYKEDIIQKQEIRELCEIIFLIDSYSVINSGYTSFPVYLYLDHETTKTILNNFSDKNFLEYVEKIFGVSKNEFIEIIVKRQKEISKWSDFKFHLWERRNYLEDFIKLKE